MISTWPPCSYSEVLRNLHALGPRAGPHHMHSVHLFQNQPIVQSVVHERREGRTGSEVLREDGGHGQRRDDRMNATPPPLRPRHGASSITQQTDQTRKVSQIERERGEGRSERGVEIGDRRESGPALLRRDHG